MYKIVDLFAGIGGIALGFHQTEKTETVFASEWDKFAQKTYLANHDIMPHGDITEIDPTTIPDHDILCGGFPCQAFSQAGKKLGFEDTRGTLFFNIAEILKIKRPKAFLLENVKNLVGHNKGETFETIMNVLDGLGYSVKYEVLRSRDFGVPQNRERIFIVGFDRSQVLNFEDFEFPEPPKTPTKLGDILESDVDDKYTISDLSWKSHQERKARHRANGKGFGYCLFDENSEYVSTILARYYKDGSEILVDQDGKNPRRLTPRECARLQGFPDDFKIVCSDTQSYKQFGNSVTVPVINAIAKSVLDVLDR